MKLSYLHLKTYFDNNYSVDELVSALERTGIELEGLEAAQPLSNKIIVGMTKKVVQHPNADKLRIVLVDVGGKNLQVVCGAPNVVEDMKVIVATIGSILPDGTEIREAKLRGEISMGMLCGESEVGWKQDDGTREIAELPDEYQIGKSLCDIVENETIVDIKSPANRPDLLSYEGIAREIAAQLGSGLKLPKAEIAAAANPKLIKKSDKKTLALGVVHMDVRHIGMTPVEVGRVLRAAGVREISPIVDITNYVNLVVGQPTHAFDAAKISLPINIRFAERGEKVKTLNGKINQLTPDDLVVADKNGPVDIAGVMGGADSEVSVSTQEIILIASTLDGMAVRKTAQRHGIRTDASARYERGLQVELADRGRAMVAQMLVTMGAKIISGARQGEVESPKVVIEVKPERINQLLGIEVPAKDMIKYLAALGFEVAGLAKLKVKVPWWRPDVTTWADIAEEIIKIVGLEALPATIPAWSSENIVFDSTRALTDKVRELLRSAGLFELTTYSFVSELDLERFGLKPAKHLKLKNPLSTEQAFMRSSLLPSLVRVIENNQRYAKNFGVSEISRVFEPGSRKGDLPNETYHLGVAVIGDYYAAKMPLDLLARELRLDLRFVPSKHAEYYPGRQADVYLGDKIIGTIGELYPRLFTILKGNRSISYTEVQLEPLISAAGAHVFAPISKYPSISRDIAVVINRNILWRDVYQTIVTELPDVKINFQSRYEGAGIPEGKISLALRATYSAMDKTLTDADADGLTKSIFDVLKKKFSAVPRS